MINQSSRKTSGSQAGIGHRLRQMLNDLSVDVWGLEKKVNQHAGEYFKKISREENIPEDRLSLKLSSTDKLSIHLCCPYTTLRPVKTTELLDFLGLSGIIPQTIEKQIMGYFSALSQQHRIPVNEIILRISLQDQQVLLRFYRDDEFQCAIHFRELLNFFHP